MSVRNHSMMRSIFLVVVCCISLFERRLLAFPVEIRLQRSNRWENGEDVIPGPTDNPTDTNPVTPGRCADVLNWKYNLLMTLEERKVAAVSANEDISLQMDGQTPRKQSVSRSRRHAHLGSRVHHHHHQPQLMRVGCVLGTCQVQNLSHRLYQLIGQSGRDDSSPINPKSPHSYG